MTDPRATRYVPAGGMTLVTPADEAVRHEEAEEEAPGRGEGAGLRVLRFGAGGGMDPAEVCRRFYAAFLACVPGARAELVPAVGAGMVRYLADARSGDFRRRLLWPDREARESERRTREVLTGIQRRIGPRGKCLPDGAGAPDEGTLVAGPESAKVLELAANGQPGEARLAVPRFLLLLWASSSEIYGALTCSDLAGLMGESKAAVSARARRLLKGRLGLMVPGLAGEEICARLAEAQTKAQAAGSCRLGGVRFGRRRTPAGAGACQ